MPTLLIIVFLAALAVAALYAFANADPGNLARHGRQFGAVALLLAAAGLALIGRWGLALPLAFFGMSMLVRGSSGFPGFPGNTRKTPGQTSRVRSRFVEMTLDHDSGVMAGTVRAGRFAGRPLDALGENELRALCREVAGDAESAALLETYLDRRMPGWRETGGFAAGGSAGAGAGAAGSAGPMTEEEARDVLGVGAGASAADIRSAHRRLMKNMHPDQGGSTWFAAKLNEARDVLLGKAGRR